MNTRLSHVINDSVELQLDGRSLFVYRYAPTFDPYESRKPYMHPIHTLKGNLITIYRPHDHVWHKGIQMTNANLSGENFWGGPTYVHGKGYVKLDNVGSMQHVGFDEITCEGEHVGLVHRLKWITVRGEEWIQELRTIRVAEINLAEGYWSLHWTMKLKNVSKRVLEFGSPTTAGRENAGYGGLFWRGPREFEKGTIRADGGLAGPEVMGKRAGWISYSGAHDQTADHSTVLFVDRPGNPNHPNKWFVRDEPYACISTSFSFDEVVPLGAGEEMTLNYRTLFADGDWDAARVERYVRELG